MREKIYKNLETIGLSDKEARVYLAALELGPSTAQKIAAKSIVNRSNTYIMIESLIKRGLMSEIEKGAKSFFVAAAPEQLLNLMAVQRQEIQQKEDLVRRLLPELAGMTNAGQGKPAVRVFEGDDVWSALQRDILASGADEVCDMSSDDAAGPMCLRGELRQEVLKKCRVRSLRQGKPAAQADGGSETRYLDKSQHRVPGELAIYGTKSFLHSSAPKSVAVLVDDANISATLCTMYMALWKAADKG